VYTAAEESKAAEAVTPPAAVTSTFRGNMSLKAAQGRLTRPLLIVLLTWHELPMQFLML